MKRPKAPPRTPNIATGEELILSEVGSGVGSGKRLNEKLRKVLGVPYAFLTESQFQDIREKAGLRDSARFELNIALRRYWIARLETKVSAKTRQLVNEARDRLEDTLSVLAQVMNNEEFFNGPIMYFQRTPAEQIEQLEETFESTRRAQRIMSDAGKRLARGPGNPSFGPLYDLIHHLDFILYKSLGVVLTRSPNRIPYGGATDTPMEYVWNVVKVANLEVAKSTVDTVLKNYIKDRDENDRMFADRAI